MSKKLTHEEYVKRMKAVHPTIEVVGTYINSATKVPLKCNICKHEWSSKMGNSISLKRGCPECSKKRVAESNRRTHEEYLNEMNKIHPNI